MPRACQTYGADSFSTSNIRRCQEYVSQMQMRLDKAVASNDKGKIRWYAHLLSKRSRAAKIVAVYHITAENEGRHTAGVDGIRIEKDGSREDKTRQRLELLKGINIERKPLPIRRVYIDKGNGKKRPLGISTMHDRIVQDIIRMAIEPIAEYHFNGNSYGYRPKRRSQDAIGHLFAKLSRKRSPRWVIEGDIERCFDNISHEHITNTLNEWGVSNPIRRTLKKMLKAKVGYGERLCEVESGTAQGNVISPMLANVALTALDDYCERYSRYNPIVRYADDFVIVCKEEEEARRIKDEVGRFLKDKVGLTLSPEKTAVTHISEGFNFLGFNIRKYRDKLIIKPQKEKVVGFLRDISELLSQNKSAKPQTIIRMLNPKLQGFRLYYRFVASKETFSKIKHSLWEKLWRWVKRRHPNKPRKWIKRKYFTRIMSEDYVFTDEKGQRILNVSKIPIVRYIKIKSEMRVHGSDERTRGYWNRRITANALRQAYSVRVEKLLRKQRGRCSYCDRLIEEMTDTHIHHIRPRSEQGTDELNNLLLIHLSCHGELHRAFTRKQMAEFTDKGIDYTRSRFVQEHLKQVT
jgi:RNA-directed DNA polymerase